ncbi:MAG TPA: hypothetical protein VJ852_01770 [Gemmatimonadaceae bacterium]|nr:hypothetical protein [Gemmatimonadaceae bacterium]
MRKSSIFAITLISVGCYHVSTAASLMDPSLHLTRTCPDAVKLYLTADRVKTDYREVALLNSTGRTRDTSVEEMIESMREKAAKIGANAIILSGIDEPKEATKVAAEATNVLTGYAVALSPARRGHALAIYIPADSADSQATCAKPK